MPVTCDSKPGTVLACSRSASTTTGSAGSLFSSGAAITESLIGTETMAALLS